MSLRWKFMFIHSISEVVEMIEKIYLVNRLLVDKTKNHIHRLSEFKKK